MKKNKRNWTRELKKILKSQDETEFEAFKYEVLISHIDSPGRDCVGNAIMNLPKKYQYSKYYDLFLLFVFKLGYLQATYDLEKKYKNK